MLILALNKSVFTVKIMQLLEKLVITFFFIENMLNYVIIQIEKDH